jgi:hypothetical protein
MKNRSLAVTLNEPLFMPAVVDAERSALCLESPPTPLHSRRAPWTIKDVLETVSETLWVVLLFLVIGFLVSKAPQIGAVLNEIAGSAHRAPAASVDPTSQAQLRELESRVSRYESKLGPIERNYALLKQRHADLVKAYDQLRKAQVRQAYAKTSDRTSPGAP